MFASRHFFHGVSSLIFMSFPPGRGSWRPFLQWPYYARPPLAVSVGHALPSLLAHADLDGAQPDERRLDDEGRGVPDQHVRLIEERTPCRVRDTVHHAVARVALATGVLTGREPQRLPVADRGDALAVFRLGVHGRPRRRMQDPERPAASRRPTPMPRQG